MAFFFGVPGRAHLLGSKSMLCFSEAGTEVIAWAWRRTAVYDVVRTVVWEDSGSNPASYLVLDVGSMCVPLVVLG